MSKQYFDNQPQVDHQIRWLDYRLGDASLKLQTDAGVFSKGAIDFGSRLLVETFVQTHQGQRQEPNDILELGSGYGPILLMLAQHFSTSHGLGVEVNERAYHLAVQNAKDNGLGDRVNFVLGDAREVLVKKDYDHVVTNPPIRAGKQVVQAFIGLAFDHLRPGGSLYVVIQKKQGAPSLEKFMGQVFGNVEKLTQDKGYWILRAIKGSR